MKINPQIKPMLFSSYLVKALIAGNKTQTRRIFNQPKGSVLEEISVPWLRPTVWFPEKEESVLLDCPFGMVGDLVYVRETWALANSEDATVILYKSDDDRKQIELTEAQENKYHKDLCQWAADVESGVEGRYRPSIHMPRWASRLTLIITNVRVERIQDISNEDAILEGCNPLDERYAVVDEFKPLWDSVYPSSWDRNDWVWVIDFEVIHKNVDQYLKTV